MKKITMELMSRIDKKINKYEVECEDFAGYAIENIIGSPFGSTKPILLRVLEERKKSNAKIKGTQIVDECIKIFAEETGFQL